MLNPKFQVNVRSQTIGPIQTCLLLFFRNAFFYLQIFFSFIAKPWFVLQISYPQTRANMTWQPTRKCACSSAQQFSISYEPIYFLAFYRSVNFESRFKSFDLNQKPMKIFLYFCPKLGQIKKKANYCIIW